MSMQSLRHLLRLAWRTRRIHRVGFLRQASRLALVKRRNPTLGAMDFYAYRLFDANHVAGARIEDFLGWRVEQDLALSLNPRTVVMPAWDKFTLTVLAHAFELPLPRLVALYRPGLAPAPAISGVHLDSPEVLGKWLRANQHWPIFAKPSYSQQSKGCYHFSGYDAADDALTRRSGDPLPVVQFVSEVVGTERRQYYQPEMGYLFQEVLRPHPGIANLLGTQAISGVRVVLVRDGDDVEFITALWKMVTGDVDTDQYLDRESGHLTARVALEDGRLLRAINGNGPSAPWQATAPRTGLALDGFVLPHWLEVRALCERAARALPMMRIQHWDIAITDQGPRILEVNDIGAIGWLQIFGTGLLTPRLRALLRRHGDASRYPWIARLCA